MRDYRRMLYRLDLGTPYQSIPALLQHFMDSSPYNGVIEMRLVTTPVASTSDPALGGEAPTPGPTQSADGTSPPSSGIPEDTSTGNSPPRNSEPQGVRNLPSSTMVTFQREGNEVNAIALYGTPTSYRTSYNESRGTLAPGSSLSSSRAYASGTVTPSRQPSDYNFDPLFAFAPSDTPTNPSAPAPSSSTISYGQPSDYGATAYPTPPPMIKRGRLPPPRPISPPFMFPHPQASLRPPPSPVIRKRFPPRTTLVWAFVPLVQRYLAAGAGTLLFECRSYTTPPSPYASHGGDGPSLDIIVQGGPYKRMVGYVGRLLDGGLAVYELADSVAATAAMDSVMLMGMAGVEAVGRGPAIAERGPSHSR